MKTIVLLLALFVQAADVPLRSWVDQGKSDAFTGNAYRQFSLEGSFPQSPVGGSIIAPTLIVKCLPGVHSIGYHLVKNGEFISASVDLGVVLNHGQGFIPVSYRLDDGKIKEGTLGISTSGTALFINEDYMDQLIYGHIGRHKEDSSPPVKKLVILVDQDMASHIVLQFDIPDPTAAAEACGLVYHKK